MFWFATIIGMIILLGCFIRLNTIYKKTNDYKNQRLYIQEYLQGVPNDLQLVNLGSTYSKFAFDNYEDLHLNGFNFALRSQCIEMDYEILQQYMNHLAPGCTVIIVVAACMLLYKDETHTNNSLYYSILPKARITGFRFDKWLEQKVPLLYHPKKIIRLIKDRNRINNIYETYSEYLTEKNVEDQMSHLVNVWKELFNLQDLKSVIFSDKNLCNMQSNVKILSSMIDFCKKNSLKPVIVIPPFSEKLNCYFSNEFVKTVVKENIQKAITGRYVPVLDYRTEGEFQKNISLFVDGGFCLNRRGSRMFMQKLALDLKQYGIFINNSTIGKITR